MDSYREHARQLEVGIGKIMEKTNSHLGNL